MKQPVASDSQAIFALLPHQLLHVALQIGPERVEFLADFNWETWKPKSSVPSWLKAPRYDLNLAGTCAPEMLQWQNHR
jgi:hypothetical protein